jgi:CO/xanthine dehydrogenase Mo-binding subunit
MAEAVEYKQIGTTPVRPDGFDKVTGRAQFGADVNLPNMIHGKVLRSPHAHALIKSVDLSAALAIPGVYAAISGADFPGGRLEGEAGGEGGGTMNDIAKNVMARNKVMYHGHAVAAVAASTPTFGRTSAACNQGRVRGVRAGTGCGESHGSVIDLGE